MVLTANWRNEIRKHWGVRVVSQYGLVGKKALWVTRCSKTKNSVRRGTPKELYVSLVNKYFYRYMEKHGLRYGVLSDKYGLHFDDEMLPYYDIHPSTLSMHEKERLGQLIRDKAMARDITQIVFYSPSPLMSVPYFEMLYHSDLNLLYTTRLIIGFE